MSTAQFLAIPAYFPPGSLWCRMEKGFPVVRIVVINPDNGPGRTVDSGSLAQVRQSQKAGLLVLGYVFTQYGSRDAAVVGSEIDKYHAWYEVNGIFLDEVSSNANYQAYYAAFNIAVKKRDPAALTVLNPGTMPDECYMSIADIMVTFEGPLATYLSDYEPAVWLRRYPPDRFWHLIYAAPTSLLASQAIALSKQRGVGWIYVTPASVPNPWQSLPSNSYWANELALVQRARE